jgi:hypothetical protein
MSVADNCVFIYSSDGHESVANEKNETGDTVASTLEQAAGMQELMTRVGFR